MIVDPKISLKIVRDEIMESRTESISSAWLFSEIDEAGQLFTITMCSPIDQEKYILEFKFDNYRLWPPYMEFIDPKTQQKGVRTAYPVNVGSNASFFHSTPCICHPCSRKAYANYGGPHRDWGEITAWSSHPQIGGLTNIPGVLRAIYCRISRDDIYRGRMSNG